MEFDTQIQRHFFKSFCGIVCFVIISNPFFTHFPGSFLPACSKAFDFPAMGRNWFSDGVPCLKNSHF